MTATQSIRPGLTMSKMGGVKPKKEAPITEETFGIRKLDIYRQHYDAFHGFRRKRERASRYKRGDQWFELTKDKNGNWVTEYQAIEASGQIPLIINVIEPAVRSLKGQFRTDDSKSVVVSRTPESSKEAEMLSNALQFNLVSVNNTKELDSMAVEELLTSGLIVQKIYHERSVSLKRNEVKIKNIDDNCFAFNSDARDIRGEDIRVTVELIDYTLENAVLYFATSPEGVYSSKREEEIRRIYSATSDQIVDTYGLDPNNNYSKNFYVSNDISKCRVILVWEERVTKIMMVHDWMNGTNEETDWTQADINKLNAYRIDQYGLAGVAPEDVPLYEGTPMYVKKWFYTYYSPFGHILREGETPFEHGGHPYIILALPLQDGEIKGVVSSQIDTQRQINRLVIQQDMILKSSIKNPLIIDKNSHDGQSIEEIGAQLKEAGAVVELDMDKNRTHPPMELHGATSNMGIPAMIDFNIRMNDTITGVNPAMQGQAPTAGTSGKLYDAQRIQSSLNSKDVMDSFTGGFRSKRDMKLLQTIQQYYDEPFMLAVSGKSYSDTAQLYDPAKVRDIKFDLTIGRAPDSPIYRDFMEETLKFLLETDKIDIELWAEQTTMPFASSFIEALRKRKEQAQGVQGQIPQGAQGQQPMNQILQQTQAVPQPN